MAGDIRGVLLCGGIASRFGSNKLLAVPAGSSAPLAVLAARNLIAGAGNVLAVMRPGGAALRTALEAEGCAVLETDRCREGLGASLAAAIGAARDADGWIVALGDMPFIRPATIEAVRAQLEIGALIAAPLDAASGARGHPVAFASTLRDELLALTGDFGARAVILRHRAELVPVPVDDPGILLDIDTPTALAAACGG
jgi:molybdenum cofactor cytidylyltransferase